MLGPHLPGPRHPPWGFNYEHITGQHLRRAKVVHGLDAAMVESWAGDTFLIQAMGCIGLPRHLAESTGGLGLHAPLLLSALMLFYLVLGCFLDGISRVVLTMGVILPMVQDAGIDLLWFGNHMVLVVEMAQITPPVGFNLFVLQGMTGREISWVAKVTLPFSCSWWPRWC